MVFPYMFIPNVYPKMVKYIVNNPALSLNPEKLRIDLLPKNIYNREFGQKCYFGITVFWSADFNHYPIYYDLNLSYSVKLFSLAFDKIHLLN